MYELIKWSDFWVLSSDILKPWDPEQISLGT